MVPFTGLDGVVGFVVGINDTAIGFLVGKERFATTLGL